MKLCSCFWCEVQIKSCTTKPYIHKWRAIRWCRYRCQCQALPLVFTHFSSFLFFSIVFFFYLLFEFFVERLMYTFIFSLSDLFLSNTEWFKPCREIVFTTRFITHKQGSVDLVCITDGNTDPLLLLKRIFDYCRMFSLTDWLVGWLVAEYRLATTKSSGSI